jgi:hypothetical protein
MRPRFPRLDRFWHLYALGLVLIVQVSPLLKPDVQPWGT